MFRTNIRACRSPVVECLEPRRLMALTAPYISEFLTLNDNGLRDDFGERSDWIEVHNPTAKSVKLGGCFLTDDAGDKRKWQFPDGASLPAGGRLLIYASERNLRVAGKPLHTNFKLSGDGEYLGLIKPDGTTPLWQFAPKYPAQVPDRSYGVASDGRVGFLASPTPGKANGAIFSLGRVSDTKFSKDRSFCDAPFDVEITTKTAGAQIRYTTDGSPPTATTGRIYAGPIRVGTTTVLRAAAFKAGYEPSDVDTQTYLFLRDVIHQPAEPVGWPKPGTQGVAGDYAMDPDVVNDPAYKSRILDDLRSVPTLSLVMKQSDLFGSKGIYTNSMKDGEEWERPVSAELIKPDGSSGFQVDAGVRIQGGFSRQPVVPKHSFRLLFKSKYGDAKLKYPLFKDSLGGKDAAVELDTLVLRGALNRTWLSGSPDGRDKAQYVHDPFAAATQLAMGQPAIQGTFVHLYVNGLYWGLYNPVERPSASFSAQYLGGKKKDYDAINSGVAVDGDLKAWNRMHEIANGVIPDGPWSAAKPNPKALASSAAYARIKRYLDVDNLIDYMLLNFYVGNYDWDHHNWYAGRPREEGAQFKFFSWDAEVSLGELSQDSTVFNNAGHPSRLFQQLRANPEFRLLFADHVQKHFFNDGALTPQKARERYLQLAGKVDRAVVGESARWGDFMRPDSPYTRNNEWAAEQRRLLAEYFPKRTSAVLNQLKALGLYPGVAAPIFSRRGGTVAEGFKLTLSKPASRAGAIYYTLDGSDPRVAGGAVSSRAVRYAGSISLTQSRTIKARILDGKTWSALDQAVFTVPRGVISGIVFNDVDGDGVRDSGERGLSGWRIYIDADDDGVFDPSERNTLSDASGAYRLNGLTPGIHRVRQVTQAGWRWTAPSSDVHAVMLKTDQSISGKNFGDDRIT